MARRCIICDKGTAFGNQRSHAENKTGAAGSLIFRRPHHLSRQST